MQIPMSRQMPNSTATYSGTSVKAQFCSERLTKRLNFQLTGRLTRYKCDNVLSTGWRQTGAQESSTTFQCWLCFLRIREFSYCTNVKIRRFNFDINLLSNLQSIFRFCHCLSNVLYSFIPPLGLGSIPGSHTAVSHQHIASFNLQQFLSHFLPFVPLTF